VLVSTLTFSATVNAIRYVGAEPVFVDSDSETWNMDPSLLQVALDDGDYAACIPVDIYGQCVDYSSIVPMCTERGVPIIEDAAEALGASHRGKPAGSFGVMAALSFNGNKIITTSGAVRWSPTTASGPSGPGSSPPRPATRPPLRAQRDRVQLPYVQPARRLGAIAAIRPRPSGRARRGHNAAYREALGDLPGVEFMPEGPGSYSTFWLTCLTIDPEVAGTDREEVRLHLESLDIESRPAWKPMHLQPVFETFKVYGGDVSARIFEHGLCLPSGSSLTEEDRRRVIAGVRSVFGR
jgi:dTDP-4-amino-4,6-dideoxygalactose transaminase